MRETYNTMTCRFVKTARLMPIKVKECASFTTPLTTSLNYKKWSQLDTYTHQHKLFTGESEDGFYLMNGIANLINYVEQRHAKGDPVKTMLFLDKSARPAAYMLRATYDYLNKHGGLRGREIASHQPATRYINIGSGEREKHTDMVASKWVGALYRPEDLSGDGVLIVDEVIASGNSVHKTGKELAKAGFSTTAPAIAIFEHLPHWYSCRHIKGIQDVGTIHNETRDEISILQNQQPEFFDEIVSAIHTYGWQSVSLLLSTNPPIYQPVPTPPHLTETIQKLKQQTTYASEAILYMASAGGFLGLRPDSRTIQKSNDFRKWLKLIIHESFRRKLINIAPRTA